MPLKITGWKSLPTSSRVLEALSSWKPVDVTTRDIPSLGSASLEVPEAGFRGALFSPRTGEGFFTEFTRTGDDLWSARQSADPRVAEASRFYRGRDALPTIWLPGDPLTQLEIAQNVTGAGRKDPRQAKYGRYGGVLEPAEMEALSGHAPEVLAQIIPKMIELKNVVQPRGDYGEHLARTRLTGGKWLEDWGAEHPWAQQVQRIAAQRGISTDRIIHDIEGLLSVGRTDPGKMVHDPFSDIKDDRVKAYLRELGMDEGTLRTIYGISNPDVETLQRRVKWMKGEKGGREKQRPVGLFRGLKGEEKPPSFFDQLTREVAEGDVDVPHVQLLQGQQATSPVLARLRNDQDVLIAEGPHPTSPGFRTAMGTVTDLLQSGRQMVDPRILDRIIAGGMSPYTREGLEVVTKQRKGPMVFLGLQPTVPRDAKGKRPKATMKLAHDWEDAQKRLVERRKPDAQGVYDPVTKTWTVPPEEPIIPPPQPDIERVTLPFQRTEEGGLRSPMTEEEEFDQIRRELGLKARLRRERRPGDEVVAAHRALTPDIQVEVPQILSDPRGPTGILSVDAMLAAPVRPGMRMGRRALDPRIGLKWEGAVAGTDPIHGGTILPPTGGRDAERAAKDAADFLEWQGSPAATGAKSYTDYLLHQQRQRARTEFELSKAALSRKEPDQPLEYESPEALAAINKLKWDLGLRDEKPGFTRLGQKRAEPPPYSNAEAAARLQAQADAAPPVTGSADPLYWVDPPPEAPKKHYPVGYDLARQTDVEQAPPVLTEGRGGAVEELLRREQAGPEVPGRTIPGGGRRKGLRGLKGMAGILSGLGLAGLVEHFGGEEAEAAPSVHLPPGRITAAVIAQKAGTQIEGPSFFDKAYTEGIDRLWPPLKGVKESKARGNVPTSPDEDPTLILPNVHGGGQGPARSFVEPIREVVEEARATPGLDDQLRGYLTARAGERAWRTVDGKATKLELTADIAKRSRRFGDARKALKEADLLREHMATGDVAPGGDSPAEIAQWLQALEMQVGPERMAKLQELSEKIYGANKLATDMMLKEGLISEKTYKTFEERGWDYVPLTRILEPIDPLTGLMEETYRYAGTKEGAGKARLSVRHEDVIKSLLGSDLPNRDPIEASVKFITAAVREAQRNKASRTFLKFMEADPQTGVKRLSSLPSKMPAGQGLLSYYEAGTPHRFLVDENWADTMNLAHVDDLEKSLKVLSKTRTAFQQLATAGNVAFAVSQIPKDIMDALMLPAYRDKGVKNVAPFLELWVKNLWEGVQEHTFGQGMSPATKEWMEAGGAYSGLGRHGDIERAVTGKGARSALNPLKAVDVIQERFLAPIEEATKKSTYQLLRKQGLSEAEAAYETRTYGGSPDYGRKGSRLASAEEYFSFLGPQLQGIDRNIRGYHRDPDKLFRHLATLTVGLMGQQAWNNQFKEQDGTPSINAVPESERLGNLIILTGKRIKLSTGADKPAYYKLPLGFAAQAIATPITEILRLGTKDPSASLAEGAASTVSNFLPGAGKIDADAPGRSLWKKFITSLNPLPKALIEQAANQNYFYDAPIVGSEIEGLEPQYQYTQRTSPTARALARAIPGDTWLSSPERFQHLWQSFLPGAGEQLMSMSDYMMGPTTLPVAQDWQEEATRVPALGAIARRFLPSRTSQPDLDLRQKFYGTANLAESATQTLNSLEQNDPAEFLRRQDLAPLREANLVLRPYKDELAELRAERKQVMSDPTLAATPEARRDLLAQIYQREQAILADGIKQLEALGITP